MWIFGQMHKSIIGYRNMIDSGLILMPEITHQPTNTCNIKTSVQALQLLTGALYKRIAR